MTEIPTKVTASWDQIFLPVFAFVGCSTLSGHLCFYRLLPCHCTTELRVWACAGIISCNYSRACFLYAWKGFHLSIKMTECRWAFCFRDGEWKLAYRGTVCIYMVISAASYDQQVLFSMRNIPYVYFYNKYHINGKEF